MYKEADNIPISKLLNKFIPIPQFTQNIHYDYKHYGQQVITQKEKIEDITKLYKERYGQEARIVLRSSGTEPIIRLMVESDDSSLAKKLLSEIHALLQTD